MQATIHKADNLNILKKLPDNTIDLIYCDILYGTGRNFTDYQDLKADRKIIEEHYKPRLIEMHRVLKNTGSIYLQMDSRINHWMRCLMDDVFGYDNFRNEIIWNRTNANKAVINKFPDNADRILYYSKSKDSTHNVLSESHSRYGTDKMLLQKTGTDSNRSDRPFLWFPIYYNEKTKELSLEKKEGLVEIYPIDTYGNEKRWCWGKDKVQKNLDKLSARKMKGIWKVYRKLPEVKEINVSNLWLNMTTGGNLIYDTQKPKALLERIIKASSNEGDLVADFYAGSHTTGEVACELGRRYIGVDIGERSYKIGQERLKKWL